MNKRYRLVVFDWEGTLSDTLGQLFNCVAEEALKLNFGTLDKEIARQSVELGLVNAIKKVFPNLTLNQHEQLLDAVRFSIVNRTNEIYLIPGAKEIIEKLHNAGIELAIATNKGYQGLLRALHSSGLEEYFKIIRSASQCSPKPSSEMLEEILTEAGIEASDTIMIGDSITDIEMAKALNVDAIGVNFYNKQPEILLAAGAIAVFSDYQEVAHYLGLS